MDYLIGPDSGDVAFDDGTWARVDAETFGSPVPLLLIDESQFPNAEDFGLLTGQQNPSGAWRVLDGLAVDVSSRYEVDVYDVRQLPDSGEWNEDLAVRVAGTVFPDPHPDQWWSDIHDKTGRIALLVGPLNQFMEPGNRVNWDFVKHARMGICCLLIRAYQSGIGTRPPMGREAADSDIFSEPTTRRSVDEGQALGLDGLEPNEGWTRFHDSQLDELADDAQVPVDETHYADIRRTWLSVAVQENARLKKMSEVVGDFGDSLLDVAPVAPGDIYSIRSRMIESSLRFVADRAVSEQPPDEQSDLEVASMSSARLWMKSPAYFLTREAIDTATPADSPLTSLALPNSKCLVFHDRPLPIDFPIGGAQRSVLAWVFVSDEQGTLEGAQIFTVADDMSNCFMTNGSIESPALRGWASKILPVLSAGHWSPSEPLKLPGKPMDRTWRRALERKRDREAATGSLDGVRLLTPPTDGDG
ncbi:hypothetical protein I3U40_08035 [Mycobacteroides abscessus subsp. abscessus]|uniref:hypothetical protein n=1 Tax=Mycobacteroides abscessus TaxID=36809 RepID=UPI0019D2CBEA|nr:hypothetical protein [Mycobacteroides abscessus]QSM95682.1 hypothetical protein I3U31_08025 [Mycobacteroides abscessus subsp. abscessus]QSN00715.1 hypothetical protein I3U40_08035 [Mycobacteroides abscessus subsp. abscessus]